jgi:MFS family permease
MRSWIQFFRANRSLASFGLLLTFFSSFGQTFLLSLYVPDILATFDLTNSAFGSIYAIATLFSALCLTWAGRYIDTINLRTFSWLVTAGLVISLLIFSQANHFVWLIVGLWGLRLSGQGLMSHTAVTTMARYFDHVRGKAISIATLGHPTGEALWPIIIALGIQFLGWRETLLGSALAVTLIVPGAIYFLLRGVSTNPAELHQSHTGPEAQAGKESNGSPLQSASGISYRQLLGSKAFWLLAPGVFALSFLNTAFFFYQLPLAESKGWSAAWVATSFTAFAFASATSMLLAGQFVDRWSAARMFPFYLFPFLAAIGLVIISDSAWITPVYLILIGISSGFGSTIKSALQAELFGVTFLGTVRSLFTALMVVSTALGPAAFGILLDAGLSFEEVLMVAAIFLSLTIIWNFRIIPRTRFLRWYLALRLR